MNIRWTLARKLALLLAVDSGLVSQEWALRTYALSGDELASWRRRYQRFGGDGLRQLKCQEMRA